MTLKNNMVINDGDVIKVKRSVFDPSIVSKKWYLHFVDEIAFYKVISITNTGKIIVKNKSGNCLFLHALDGSIVGVYA